jgi:hypothetical protein
VTLLDWLAVEKPTPRWFALLTMAVLLFFAYREIRRSIR